MLECDFIVFLFPLFLLKCQPSALCTFESNMSVKNFVIGFWQFYCAMTHQNWQIFFCIYLSWDFQGFMICGQLSVLSFGKALVSVCIYASARFFSSHHLDPDDSRLCFTVKTSPFHIRPHTRPYLFRVCLNRKPSQCIFQGHLLSNSPSSPAFLSPQHHEATKISAQVFSLFQLGYWASCCFQHWLWQMFENVPFTSLLFPSLQQLGCSSPQRLGSSLIPLKSQAPPTTVCFYFVQLLWLFFGRSLFGYMLLFLSQSLCKVIPFNLSHLLCVHLVENDQKVK